MIKKVTHGFNASVGNGTKGIAVYTDELKYKYEYKLPKIGTRKRVSLCAIVTLGLLCIYSFCSARYLFGQNFSFLNYFGAKDAALRRCLDSSGELWTPRGNHLLHPSNMHQKNESTIDFRILCTTGDRRITWGSYKLRCDDLKSWAEMCAPNVHMTVGISLEKLHEQWNRTSRIRYIPSPNDTIYTDLSYDSTIFIKAMSTRNYSQFGNKFIDMVDEYNWKEEMIPPEMHLLLQTRWQGQSIYPNRTSSVVEHWYNSYPSDMTKAGYPKDVPSVAQKSWRRLNIATIWNTKRSHDITEGGCPKTKIPGVKYHCIDKDFDITSWYLEFMKSKNDKCQMMRTMADPQLGIGMLYYNVFRKFDALVVLAKNDSMKLQYGNVQRAISQMRSGVPVLLEVRGRVFEDFMNLYNYSCAFRRYHDEPIVTLEQSVPLMTFDEAVEQLKNPEVRRDCQRQGLEIVKDYSPSKIGQKFLKAVGYSGDFLC